MKTIVLSIVSCIPLIALSQNNSDLQPTQINENASKPAKGLYQNNEGKSVVINGNTVTSCDSGSVTLSVTGACTYDWYSDAGLSNLLISNNDLSTPTLYTDQSYFLASYAPATEAGIPLPAQSSTFSGSVRGYWFQAPSNFMITGLKVPTDASSGLSNIAVVRFNAGAPPTYSTVTNDFVLLGYWPQSALDTIHVCIPVQSGEYIGILGNRASINSYASGPYTSDIAGTPVTITRLGMQFDLATTSPMDLWQEPTGSISRVEMIYSTSVSTVVTQVDVTVPHSFENTITANICTGDSLLIGGAYQNTPGLYTDTYATIYGCDSIIHTDLQVDFVDVSTTHLGGIITANASGAGYLYQWIDCSNGSPIVGETAINFTPTANGEYAVIVNDGNCSDTSDCVMVNYIGLKELNGSPLHFYPNPASDQLTIQGASLEGAAIRIYDASGRLVYINQKIGSTQVSIPTHAYESGVYILRVSADESEVITSFVKK